MTCFQRKIKWNFAILACENQVSAAVDQDANCLQITVLGCGMERSIAALFANIWVCSMFEKQFHDFRMSRCGGRLNGRGLEFVAERGVDRRAGFDQILSYIVMTKITGQSKCLEAIVCIGIDQLWVARQESQDRC